MVTFPFFDAVVETTRFQARKEILDRQARLRVELAPGVIFQPETAESVEDQIIETLWVEGKTLDQVDASEREELRASFAVLSPRRERGGRSLVATLMLGFPDSERGERLARLHDLPGKLRLLLEDGQQLLPQVDRGFTGDQDRLPAVLALRYLIPNRLKPLGLIADHSEINGHWSRAAWKAWG
jgi:hypothetical protein